MSIRVTNVSIGNRTAQLIQHATVMSPRFSEFPSNIGTMFSVTLTEGTSSRVSQSIPEVIRFLRGDLSTERFLAAIRGSETALAVTLSRLLGNTCVFGESADQDELMRQSFDLGRAAGPPRLTGASLHFTHQVWRSPDSLIGQCERVQVDLASGIHLASNVSLSPD